MLEIKHPLRFLAPQVINLLETLLEEAFERNLLTKPRLLQVGVFLCAVIFSSFHNRLLHLHAEMSPRILNER